ncbi:MAG: hypothetical protein KF878_04410 [Planctomycetes bacterium]|nr:hypothetical protein [Planctomycetota bacterium]
MIAFSFEPADPALAPGLGHLTVRGDLGEATTRGGPSVLLLEAAADLLDVVVRLLAAPAQRSATFVAAGSSFALRVERPRARRAGGALSVHAGGGEVARVAPDVLRTALAAAVRDLVERHAPALGGSPSVLDDLARGLRALDAPSTGGSAPR